MRPLLLFLVASWLLAAAASPPSPHHTPARSREPAPGRRPALARNGADSVLVAALARPGSAAGRTVAPGENRLERGRYLVEDVALCAQCHTPRDARGELDRERWLHGGPVVFTSNLGATGWAFEAPALAGLPAWSAADAVQLLVTGLAPDGKPPRPPMPPYRFSPEDAAAIVAYLKSLPPPQR